MKAEIVSCGTELLLGRHIDTNAAYLSNALSVIGIDVFHHITVGDNRERLANVLNESLSRADIVIITGGLGPTVDDITMGTIAAVIKKDLLFKKEILKDIKNHFKQRSLKLPKDTIKQALIPRGAEWIPNKVGTAPGLIIKDGKRHLIALPGPPRELMPMVEKRVLPYLKKLQPQACVIRSKSLKVIGLPESKVNERVKDLLGLSGRTTLGIYAHLGEVELRITSKAKSQKKAVSQIRIIEREIGKRLDDLVYGAGEETLNSVVGEILKKRRKTLAIAESCTGGLVSDLITNTPGSSKYFIAGIVAYSNGIKIKTLCVDKAILKKYGAVSRRVAKEMAKNIRELAGADIGLAITGIAGPTGRSKKKPIGLVYIALIAKKKGLVKEFRFLGSREEIKLQSAQQALNLLRLNI